MPGRRYIQYNDFDAAGLQIHDFEVLLRNGNTNLFLSHGKEFHFLDDAELYESGEMYNVVLFFPETFTYSRILRSVARFRYTSDPQTEETVFVFSLRNEQSIKQQYIYWCKERYLPVLTPYPYSRPIFPFKRLNFYSLFRYEGEKDI